MLVAVYQSTGHLKIYLMVGRTSRLKSFTLSKRRSSINTYLWSFSLVRKLQRRVPRVCLSLIFGVIESAAIRTTRNCHEILLLPHSIGARDMNPELCKPSTSSWYSGIARSSSSALA